MKYALDHAVYLRDRLTKTGKNILGNYLSQVAESMGSESKAIQ